MELGGLECGGRRPGFGCAVRGRLDVDPRLLAVPEDVVLRVVERLVHQVARIARRWDARHTACRIGGLDDFFWLLRVWSCCVKETRKPRVTT